MKIPLNLFCAPFLFHMPTFVKKYFEMGLVRHAEVAAVGPLAGGHISGSEVTFLSQVRVFVGTRKFI